jgi:glycosyltransferase involved in cell wall biosynthesis
VTPLAAGEEFRPETEPARLEAVRQRYALPRAPFILSLCTLEPRKNLPHLIRAFAEMLRSDPARETHLVLAGAKGWDFDDLFREREALENCRHRIHCPGRIAEEDLAAVYSAAQLFVYPSLYEGFGLPALEAMQCGLPVIASDTSSLPEVVGDAGLLVSPTDQAALVAAMRSLLDSADLRRELRARGLARAREFSWARTMDLTLGAYRTALAAAGGGDFDS